MTTSRVLSLAFIGALLLTGCGGNDDGVKLGEFPAINLAEGDTIELKAPSSRSPAAFSFSSSNPAVATVDGTKLTGKLPGTVTITAGQGEKGSYNPTSTSTTATVAAYVNHAGLVWRPVSTDLLSATEATDFCKDTKIKDVTGWRLPTQAELTALLDAGALSGKGWLLPDTWTSNANTTSKTHTTINLSTKAAVSLADDKKAAVTCVKPAG